MSTQWDVIYERFFKKIEKDADFFVYYNISNDEAMELAKERAKSYLIESIVKLTLNCTPDIDFNDYDESAELFNEVLTNTEIDLLANLMREQYHERDLSSLKAFEIKLSPKDFNVFSPANERKTFMDMFKDIQGENRKLISQYTSRDRITGKKKIIDYSQYSSE